METARLASLIAATVTMGLVSGLFYGFAAPLPSGVLDLIASPVELAHLDALARADPSLPWDRVFFSAKEATYKAWYPATGIRLGFRDATLFLSPTGTFAATLRPPVAPPVSPVYEGRWLSSDRLVLTAVSRGEQRCSAGVP